MTLRDVMFIAALGAMWAGGWQTQKLSHNANATIKTDHVTVMEKGEHTYRIPMTHTTDNGRRIFVEGISLGERWDQSEGVEQVRESVVFPRSFKGKIIVTIRHIPNKP